MEKVIYGKKNITTKKTFNYTNSNIFSVHSYISKCKALVTDRPTDEHTDTGNYRKKTLLYIIYCTVNQKHGPNANWHPL